MASKTLMERAAYILKNAKKNKTCLEFNGVLHKLGYGNVSFKSKNYRAHRLTYELKYGSIPSNLMVCHKCDNRACIKPEHLFLGSAKDNLVDSIKKGRRSFNEKTCSRGHRFKNNTRIDNGHKKCRICEGIRNKIKSIGVKNIFYFEFYEKYKVILLIKGKKVRSPMLKTKSEAIKWRDLARERLGK